MVKLFTLLGLVVTILIVFSGCKQSNSLSQKERLGVLPDIEQLGYQEGSIQFPESPLYVMSREEVQQFLTIISNASHHAPLNKVKRCRFEPDILVSLTNSFQDTLKIKICSRCAIWTIRTDQEEVMTNFDGARDTVMNFFLEVNEAQAREQSYDLPTSGEVSSFPPPKAYLSSDFDLLWQQVDYLYTHIDSCERFRIRHPGSPTPDSSIIDRDKALIILSSVYTELQKEVNTTFRMCAGSITESVCLKRGQSILNVMLTPCEQVVLQANGQSLVLENPALTSQIHQILLQ